VVCLREPDDLLYAPSGGPSTADWVGKVGKSFAQAPLRVEMTRRLAVCFERIDSNQSAHGEELLILHSSGKGLHPRDDGMLVSGNEIDVFVPRGS